MENKDHGKVIISYKDLKVKLTRKADEDIFALLTGTTLGTKGGMRYQLRDTPGRIKDYGDNIRFVSLYMRERLAGTIGFCYREMSAGGKAVHGSYLRYFSVMPMFQAALDARGRADKQRNKKNGETWKDEVLAFFRRPRMLDFPGYGEDDKHVVFAYVESMNERSKTFVQQVGFEHIRTFHTMAFSRFSPRRSVSVQELGVAERVKMKALLKDFYSSHTLYQDDFVFNKDKYYVIRDGEEIIAGISVVTASFRVVDMPGFWGRLSMKILPLCPGFRKIFRPEELRFLVFQSPYVKKGREKSLETLMESACAIEGYKLGLTWLDDRSELYDTMVNRLNMGLLNRILKTKPGLVYASFINFTRKEKEPFYDRPAYISGFDFT